MVLPIFNLVRFRRLFWGSYGRDAGFSHSDLYRRDVSKRYKTPTLGGPEIK